MREAELDLLRQRAAERDVTILLLAHRAVDHLEVEVLEPAQREQAFATYQQEERERQRAAARRDFEALLAERPELLEATWLAIAQEP